MAKKRAEIMATVTPAQVRGHAELVRQMHEGGMESVRLNTAHFNSVEELGNTARCLKKLCPNIKILIDTKGPEMRTNALASPKILNEGDSLTIIGVEPDSPAFSGSTAEADICVNFPRIHEYVAAGNELLIDDGRIRLSATAVEGGIIRARVSQGGELGSRKGFAVAGVDVDLPAVSARDRAFISYGASNPDIDIIAHSFVRCAADVLAVRQAMGQASKPIVAKIENQQGIDHLAEIIAVADGGILIARGDLTASLGADRIPAAQAIIAEATTRAGLPLYLATNILSSLMSSPTPSASDVKGISTALAQGVDVLLLTNETAAGPRPLESVKILKSESNI